MANGVTHLATSATCSQSMCDPRRMVVTFMAALTAKELGLSNMVDRGLGRPE